MKRSRIKFLAQLDGMILNTIDGTFGRFIKATGKIITQTRKL